MKFTKILVPTDFSEATADAVAYAADFAKDHNAELVLCHVLEPSPYAAGLEAGTLARAPEAQELHDSVKDQLGIVRAKFVPQDVACRAVLVDGTPHQEIVELADKEGVDLIVMPTSGRSGLAHLLLGSVAEKVIRKAHCPVLVFRAKE